LRRSSCRTLWVLSKCTSNKPRTQWY
ncbi:tat (twin-arginine translocation) pathway signal sequence domain protein, partial [Vibrio parahaemolyticus IDH02640]